MHNKKPLNKKPLMPHAAPHTNAAHTIKLDKIRTKSNLGTLFLQTLQGNSPESSS